MDFPALTDTLMSPLCRLVLTMGVGMLLAGLIESLHWTRFAARLALPLARMGYLREAAGASFSLAFFSPAAANALLADAYAAGTLSRRELVFANLFNSSPAFLVHLPTVFSMAFAFLGSKAYMYVGLTFAAAISRTICTVIAGRCLLPRPARTLSDGVATGSQKRHWRQTVKDTLTRCKKRIFKVLVVTIPVYCVFFALQQAGCFALLEKWLAGHAGMLSFLNPHAISIIAISLAAESGAAMSAAASLSAGGSLADHEVITALLAGNIIAAPMRALRHQFPSYAGMFSPGLALYLVLVNQLCRAASLIAVTALYYWHTA
ncbi:MAG: hypothetical protein LBD42_01060 [Desulfovibrio sp.]|jgi:hypothetical protein|nr:hypothetical protein [Desulfovibrio sp.]